MDRVGGYEWGGKYIECGDGDIHFFKKGGGRNKEICLAMWGGSNIPFANYEYGQWICRQREEYFKEAERKIS